jgi:hypothetical protein
MGYLLKKNKTPLVGQLLLKGGEISSEQLLIALKEQEETGEMLGIILIELGFITGNILTKYLAIQTKLVHSKRPRPTPVP